MSWQDVPDGVDEGMASWWRLFGGMPRPAPVDPVLDGLRYGSAWADETACAMCLKAACPGTCVGVSPHRVEKCGHMVLAPGVEDMRTGEEDPPAFLRCSSEAGHAGPVHSAKLLDGTVWRWFNDNSGRAVAASETWRTEGLWWAL